MTHAGEPLSDSNAPVPWRAGYVVFGKYTIVERVGRGGMATVYAARHRNGKRVALKALHPVHCASKAAVERFFREGTIANLVEHPGALEVYDEGRTDDGVCVLVCEYLEGCTLHEFQRSTAQPLSVGEVMDALLQVLDVLIVAHAARVVHRDIKPTNLFLTTDGRVKLLDFGVARLPTGSDELLTIDGELLGTPAFMPPEQARGLVEQVDATSDLWSVAATALALLSGKAPRQGRSVSELLMAAIGEPMPPASSFCAQLPSGLAAALDRALSTDKSLRFASAKSFRDELLMHWDPGSAPGLSGEIAREVQVVRERTARLDAKPPASVARHRWVGGAVAIGAICAALAWKFSSLLEPPPEFTVPAEFAVQPKVEPAPAKPEQPSPPLASTIDAGHVPAVIKHSPRKVEDAGVASPVQLMVAPAGDAGNALDRRH